MKADDVTISSMIYPDLFVPPHILPILKELLTYEEQQASLYQEELGAHLTTCHHCRKAVMSLLSIAEEHESRDSNSNKALHIILLRLAQIQDAIEARELEQLGAYAETIVAQGREAADQFFPDVAAHLRTCADCRSMLIATVACSQESADAE